MPVLLLSHLFPNPHEPLKGTFVLEKARALHKHMGCIVVAPVSWFPGVRSVEAIPEVEQIDGLTVYHPRYLALPDALFGYRWIPYAAALKRLFARIRPVVNVCQAEWIYPDAYALVRSGFTTHRPCVMTVHGNSALCHELMPTRNRWYQTPLQQADAIVAVSNDLKQRVMKAHGLSFDRIQVMGNGVDTTVIRRLPQDASRTQLQIPTSARMVVCVARLSEEKNLPMLIEAATRCCTPEVRFFILGEGPMRPTLEADIRRRQLSGRVTLVGNVARNQLALWLSAADLFCLPSRHEGHPVAILEALACGVPVVATAVGGVPDIVISSDYGLLCAPNDPAQLTDRIDTALATSWNTQRIMAYGSQFTWDQVADQLCRLYARLQPQTFDTLA